MNDQEDYYRGYLLVRLAKIGTEWDISEMMMKLKDEDKQWDITYATPIYGAWDMIVEISFKELGDLDRVVTKLRADSELRDLIEETTTLVSSKANYDSVRKEHGKI